ncbi:MAG: chromosome partitioning protein ParB, partial [Candidatus Komeilibacteria bacterium CG_4_9_14_3_um_filter_37_5]
MLNNKGLGLGRGLSSLIPNRNIVDNSSAPEPNRAINDNAQSSSGSTDNNQLLYLSPKQIRKNPYQPRTTFNHQELEELAESIKRYGILEPLIVVLKDGYYQLIAGERRWQAATLIGLEKVPVMVRQADDLEVMEISLIENLQREDLDPIEEALAYQRLIEEFQLTQEQVARKVQKNRVTVANAIRILQLPKDIQEAIRLGAISRSQAKIILSVNNPKDQIRIFKKIVNGGLTVRQTDHLASNYSVKRKIKD